MTTLIKTNSTIYLQQLKEETKKLLCAGKIEDYLKKLIIVVRIEAELEKWKNIQ